MDGYPYFEVLYSPLDGIQYQLKKADPTIPIAINV